MLLAIPKVLSSEQLARVREPLATAAWIDGRSTAGHQGAAVKRNQQLEESSPLARELGDRVLGAAEELPVLPEELLGQELALLAGRLAAGVEGVARDAPGGRAGVHWTGPVCR